jgi:lysophospholipase L1-like esterase
MDSKYTPETVHPNLAGYAVMEKLIVPVVEKLR